MTKKQNEISEMDSWIKRIWQVEQVRFLRSETRGQSFGALGQTKDGKRVCFVQGTPYERGFLRGLLNGSSIQTSISRWLPYVASQLFASQSFDLRIGVQGDLRDAIYEVIINGVTKLMMEHAVTMFWTAHKAGDIPKHLVQEMKGIAQGALAGSFYTPLTLNDIVALNYGMEYLISQLYSGKLVENLKRMWLDENKEDAAVQVAQEHLQLNDFRPPDMCAAILCRGKATKSGADAWMARDFQFANGRTFHRIHMHVIQKMDTHFSSVGLCVPGMVGYITGLNERGLSSGVHLIRSVGVNGDRPGLGSLLAVRSMCDSSASFEEARVFMQQRFYHGTPWLYPVMDHRGMGGILEVVAPGDYLEDPVAQTDNKAPPYHTSESQRYSLPLSEFLPPTDYLKRLEHPKSHPESGVFVRCLGDPTRRIETRDLHRVNQPLMEQAQIEIENEEDEKFLYSPTGVLFHSWKENLRRNLAIGNSYFCPPRDEYPDIMVATNHFITPRLRITQMDTSMREISVDSDSQWRYDMLAQKLHENYGTLNFEILADIMTFLSPKLMPRYPTNHTYKDLEPEQTPIEGAISLIDTRKLVFYTKAGLWGHEWQAYHLKLYLST